MRIYTYSEARLSSKVLNEAESSGKEIIRRKDGKTIRDNAGETKEITAGSTVDFSEDNDRGDRLDHP
ncbi:MAG: hypothetical protein WBM02_11865 [bacterium]